jgi:hypothetical protein
VYPFGITTGWLFMVTQHGLVRVTARGAMVFALFSSLLLPAVTAFAEDKEPLAVVELGAAAEWSLNGGGSSFGPVAAVEFTPIRNWLEIETGVSPMFGRRTEWDTDFVFKKPFDLSPKVEFEPGIGPVWMHTPGGATTDGIGAEAVADFMFWPTQERKYGWFLEPSYTYSFSSGHEQSFGVSVGLLIAIP